jgi:hypothetical protein
MACGGELVSVEHEVVLVSATDGDRSGADGDLRALLEVRAALDDEVHRAALACRRRVLPARA